MHKEEYQNVLKLLDLDISNIYLLDHINQLLSLIEVLDTMKINSPRPYSKFWINLKTKKDHIEPNNTAVFQDLKLKNIFMGLLKTKKIK